VPIDVPGIPTLTTPRLVLRPFVFDDLDELAAIHAEESFWWYPLRSAMSKDDTVGFLERVLARYESDRFGIEALLDRGSGTMIGWAGLAVPHFLPEILPAVEVGWRLSTPWRGRGLATEAGAAALEFGFTTGGLERIVSIYEPENIASGRVMEHLGLTYWRSATGNRGEEMVVTELTRTRWEHGRG
jgi:RimJ/RimL family protein N-acetyltransferase